MPQAYPVSLSGWKKQVFSVALFNLCIYHPLFFLLIALVVKQQSFPFPEDNFFKEKETMSSLEIKLWSPNLTSLTRAWGDFWVFCLETAMLLWLPCLRKQPAVSGTKILAIPGKKKKKTMPKYFPFLLKKKYKYICYAFIFQRTECGMQMVWMNHAFKMERPMKVTQRHIMHT